MDPRKREIIHKYKPVLSQIVSCDKLIWLVKKYKIFTKAMFDDIFGPYADRNFCDELCTRGPNAFLDFIKVLNDAKCNEIADVLQNESDNEIYPIYYKMDSKPLGYCLIIINKKFEVEDDRLGCEVDASALENLFKELNYDVQIEWDKEGEEIIYLLREFSRKSEFRNVDSCIVYILSHGGQDENLDYILGTDSMKVYKRDICNMFDNKNCELLINKPKIFFFQACRGKLLDYGVIENSKETDVIDNTCKNIEKQNSTDEKGIPNPKFNKDKKVKSKYPLSSDMFVVHSSLPDHQSWKNHVKGSWLCQDLVSVISEYYTKYDLATMMTFVNSKQVTRESEDGCKQIAFVEMNTTGLIHFNRSKKEVCL
ncbi:caspase-2-like [Argiope bruennichi]|uniref:caspase-2-like n=1 Tax=Argiope bruennichi TaxID=94029 RepID=UPI0024942CF4|nr:caspase-2-like [Argiope bruennichi]